MPNKIQIKRTTTSGLLPNVSNSSNTSYIAAGELAINLTDRKLLSSNGSATFEIGANLASISVGGALTGNSTGLFVSSAAPQISLNNVTSNWITFSTNGVAAPTTTTRSAGTKLALYPSLNASQVDYAIGIESNHMWFSTDNATTGVKFYANTSNYMTANVAGLYHTGTINAASFTVGATVVANSTAVFATRLNSKTEGNLNVNNAVTSGAVTVTDTRAAQTTPETLASPLVDFDFKQNTTEGLSDGGTYFGEMTFRPYGTTTDWTGGPSHQLGFTSNNNVYHRSGNSTTWGAWARLYKEGTVLAAGNTTITGFANVSGIVSADYYTASNNGNGTNYRVGDDAWLGDINTADTVGLKGQQNASYGYIKFGTAPTSLGYNGTSLIYSSNTSFGNTSVTGFINVSSTAQFGSNVILGTTTISANGSVGTAGQILTSGGSGNVYWSTGGGGGSPGGANTQIQFNDGGSFGGDAGLTYNKTTDALTVAGALTVNGAVTVPNTAALGNTTVTGFANVTTTATIGTGFTLTSGNANFDSGLLFVDGTNDRVGIGTTSPVTRLEVKGTGFVASSISGDSTSETQLRFFTNTGARISQQANQALSFDTNATERMRITSAGNLGVGTTTPGRRLSIAGGGFAFDDANTTTRSIHWGDGTNYPLLIQGDATNGFITFNTHASGNGPPERMRITSAGNVGIGNASPAHTLSVTGTTNLAGAVTGITTLAAGNTTITGFANVTSTIQGGAGLTIAGAASGITTLAAGNTTITGFANVSSTLNAAGAITQNGNQVLHAGNYTSYAPSLTGSGASGNWGINITGNAGTVTNGVYTTGNQTISGAKVFSDGVGVDGGGASNDPYGRMSVTRPADANNYSYYGMTRAGTMGAGFGLDASNRFWWGQATSGYAGVSASIGMTMTVAGIVTASSDFRAPIFYDSNNTAYYLDAANAGSYDALKLNGGIQFAIANPYLQSSSYFVIPGGAYFNSGTVYTEANIKARGGVGNDTAAALTLTGGTGGYTQINGSARSPIFYDSDNTGYLVDAAGTSFLNVVGMNGNLDVYGNQYLRSSFLLLNTAGNDWNFVIDRNGGNNWIVYGGNSVRAPIFYDSNDTAYLVDGASNSNLNTLSMAGLITGRSSAATDVNTANDTGSFSARGNTSTVACMSFHRTNAYAINMGLGTDNVFRIGGWSASNNAFQMDGSGNLTMLNNVTAYSDARLKKDIVKIENALDKVQQINGYTYTRTDTGSRQSGVIAQEVMKVLPEVVMGSEETNYSVAYGNMVGLLIEAIKEQQEHINRLEVKINSLQGN